MKKIVLLVVITVAVILVYPANGQNCTCESNFEWVKKTFEENDAGFQYIIDKKGQTAYNMHNQLMLEKIKSAKTLTECTELLYEWLKFFRSGHIGIERLTQKTSPLQPAQVIGEPEMWNVDILQFENYISTKKDADYEGIWQVGAYKVGIKREGESYIGFIIEADVDGWRKPGLVKLKIEPDGDKLKSTYYMRDYSPVVSGEPELIGKNYLKIGQQHISRLSPIFPADPFIENYFKSISSPTPYLEELNVTTLYFRIPSFNLGNKSAIDKVIADNKDKILVTKNLIIDLRNNGGGGDASFAELLPLMYTNPIRTIGMEFLSTKLNNQNLLDLLTSEEYDFPEETRQLIRELVDKFQGREGEFVNPSDELVSITHSDIIYEYPKNIGIIVNDECGSTTEQFLLAAKQSKKVKLFGVTTAGVLDISNMLFVVSPCEEFALWYSQSRSMRIPGMVIDEIGLQPDYYIDKTIPQYKWVEFVNEILNY